MDGLLEDNSPFGVVSLLQLFKLCLEPGQIDILGGHQNGVFPIIYVVASSYAYLGEAILGVETLGSIVRGAHLQGNDTYL